MFDQLMFFWTIVHCAWVGEDYCSEEEQCDDSQQVRCIQHAPAIWAEQWVEEDVGNDDHKEHEEEPQCWRQPYGHWQRSGRLQIKLHLSVGDFIEFAGQHA